MANILIFNFITPFPENLNGNTIRVLPLSRELAKKHTLFLFTLDLNHKKYSKLKKTGIYEKILQMSPPTGCKTPLRYFFPLRGSQTRVALPKEYQRILTGLKRVINEWHIDLIIAHTSRLAEYVESIKSIPVILDVIDSASLVNKRSVKYGPTNKRIGIKQIINNIYLARIRYMESHLTDSFSYIITASKADRNHLRSMTSHSPANIVDIPNGVSDALISPPSACEEIKNAIGFWGVLDFPPNYSAIRFFYENVFFTHLKDKEVLWYIIGKNADDWIKSIAKRHDNIILTGYVEDLFALAARIPIVVNPMQMGSGVKNKVLEAFALKRTVISNAMGIEALPAEKGYHYIAAEKPIEFAQNILNLLPEKTKRDEIGEHARNFILSKYRWNKIGSVFSNLVDSALAEKRFGTQHLRTRSPQKEHRTNPMELP